MSYPLLRKELDMDSYFCDPQAPWQKGSVESNNNRIRRFFPRETNLETVDDADLYGVCVILNNTPRKCLGYRTPQEVLDAHLQQAA
jgi:transposase, IS30 family